MDGFLSCFIRFTNKMRYIVLRKFCETQKSLPITKNVFLSGSKTNFSFGREVRGIRFSFHAALPIPWLASSDKGVTWRIKKTSELFCRKKYQWVKIQIRLGGRESFLPLHSVVSTASILHEVPLRDWCLSVNESTPSPLPHSGGSGTQAARQGGLQWLFLSGYGRGPDGTQGLWRWHHQPERVPDSGSRPNRLP